jgi:CubicO group peptidase (beta-lactamase class C family)
MYTTCVLAALSLLSRGEMSEVETAVAEARKIWRVPGVAVVVVRDGQVSHLIGQGVRQIGRPEPMTPDTLFAISSCSKAFTSAALARLVEEGKANWDDPVRKHLPGFRLADPLASQDVRLRDLLCHRTGLAANELLWHGAPWSPEEAVRRAAFLPLTRPFRTSIQYQNTMVTAAGLAAGRAAGQSWADLIRTRLLEPLQLRQTYLDTASIPATAPRAATHRLDDAGQAYSIPAYTWPTPDPAVSIHTTARDLGAWLCFHLSGGQADGKQVVGSRFLAETYTPHMPIPLSTHQKVLFPATVQLSYALGWTVSDYHGLRLIAHGGSIDGSRCHVLFVPEKRFGLAVLANLHETPLTLALAHTLLDAQLDLPRRDWHALHRWLRLRLLNEATERGRERLLRRQVDGRPALPLTAFVGTYENLAYGNARLCLSEGRLHWLWQGRQSVLDFSHDNTFTLADERIGEADVVFSVEAGKVSGVHVGGRLAATFRKIHPSRSP